MLTIQVGIIRENVEQAQDSKESHSINSDTKQSQRLKSKGDGLDVLAEGLSSLLELGNRLVASDSSSPSSSGLLVLVGEVGLGGRDEGGKSSLVLTIGRKGRVRFKNKQEVDE